MVCESLCLPIPARPFENPTVVVSSPVNAASKSFSVLSISWRGPRVKSRSESSGPQNISPTTIYACLVKTVGEGPARLELLKLQDLFTSGVTGWKADFRYMDCESLARVEPGGFEEV